MGRKRGKVGKLSQKGHFQSFFSKTKLRSSTLPVFLPLIDSPNGLPKLKVVVFSRSWVGVVSAPPFRRRCGYQIPSYRKDYLPVRSVKHLYEVEGDNSIELNGSRERSILNVFPKNQAVWQIFAQHIYSVFPNQWKANFLHGSYCLFSSRPNRLLSVYNELEIR